LWPTGWAAAAIDAKTGETIAGTTTTAACAAESTRAGSVRWNGLGAQSFGSAGR